MGEIKTKVTDRDVGSFVEQIEELSKREDCKTLLKWMQEITQHEPKMWGTSIVGFGTYHYKYKSGHEGDFFLTGFSPRKQNLTIYIMNGFERYRELCAKLGTFKTGKSCLYIKDLKKVDETTLKQLIGKSVQYMNDKYNA